MLKRRAEWLNVGLTALALCGLVGCGRAPLPSPGVSGELVVATLNGPTTYYTDHEGHAAGFEYDLVARFAESQNWQLRVEVKETQAELLDAVRKGQAHLAAAGLINTPERARNLAVGPTYAEVQTEVVCNARGRIPTRLEDMQGLRFEVVAGSSQAEFLQQWIENQPTPTWSISVISSPDDLLERVAIGLSDCAVTDSDSLAVAHNFYPDLTDAFVLQKAQPLAWVMRRGVDVGLSRAVSQFFRDMKKGGLADLRERYYGHVMRLGDADVTGILERRRQLLPALLPHFQQAQQETGIDWRFLAAIAYQESQWDEHAVSPTGVRGIMMLTEATADRMGVENRLDARESILGGARYIALLRDGLPASIPEPDRTWLALAAYNIGAGHLEDARVLARRVGKDPNNWGDMKTVLPMLARSQHYATLKYGFARGGEARAFAENVRIYFDILKRYEPVEPDAPPRLGIFKLPKFFDIQF